MVHDWTECLRIAQEQRHNHIAYDDYERSLYSMVFLFFGRKGFGRLDTFWNHHVHWVQH